MITLSDDPPPPIHMTIFIINHSGSNSRNDFGDTVYYIVEIYRKDFVCFTLLCTRLYNSTILICAWNYFPWQISTVVSGTRISC
jgi:hypothetical protein